MCSAAAVHLGTSLETVMVVEGVSVNMPMLAISEVGEGNGKLEHVQLSMLMWQGRIQTQHQVCCQIRELALECVSLLAWAWAQEQNWWQVQAWGWGQMFWG